MKREKQDNNQAIDASMNRRSPAQVGAIVDQAKRAAPDGAFSGCDKELCGKHCTRSQTCESLAGLLFNFRMIWGA